MFFFSFQIRSLTAKSFEAERSPLKQSPPELVKAMTLEEKVCTMEETKAYFLAMGGDLIKMQSGPRNNVASESCGHVVSCFKIFGKFQT